MTDAAQIGQRLVAVEIDRLGDVHFCNDRSVGGVEDGRVFERFILPLCGGKEHDTQVFAKIEIGGADEVTDVFNDKEIKVVKVQNGGGFGNHFGVEVTDRAGGDLDDSNAGFAQPRGVIVRGEITHDNADPPLAFESKSGLANEAGFAGAGRGNHVEGEKAPGLKRAAVPLGEPVIFFEKRAIDGDGRGVGGRVGGMRMRMSVLMVMMLMLMFMPVLVLTGARFGCDFQRTGVGSAAAFHAHIVLSLGCYSVVLS